MSNAPRYIHHVNFPTTDPERTDEWYTKVFGLKADHAQEQHPVVLMTRGNFDLHFTPVEEMDRMAPYHFAVEVEDWDDFLAHLEELGIRHTRADRAAGEPVQVLLHPRPRPHDDRARLPRQPPEAGGVAPGSPGNGSPGNGSADNGSARNGSAGKELTDAHHDSDGTSIYYETPRQRTCDRSSCTARGAITPPGGSRCAALRDRASPSSRVDLRGFGKSDSTTGSSSTARTFPDDVVAVLAAAEV